jgi:hypothetical protein
MFNLKNLKPGEWVCECGRINSALSIECNCKAEEEEIDIFLDSLDWFSEFEENDLTEEQDEEELRRPVLS